MTEPTNAELVERVRQALSYLEGVEDWDEDWNPETERRDSLAALSALVDRLDERDENIAYLHTANERLRQALGAIEAHGASLDSDILSVQSIARTALAKDSTKGANDG